MGRKTPFYLNQDDYGNQLVADALAGQNLYTPPQPGPAPLPEMPNIGGKAVESALGIQPQAPQFTPDMLKVSEVQAPIEAPKVQAPQGAAKPAAKEVVQQYIAKKYGFGDQDALDRAMASADRTRLMADLGSAGDKIGAAIAGVKQDSAAYDRLRESADQGVKDIQTKRAGKIQDAQFGDIQREQEGKSLEDDPSSPVSKIYQHLMGKMAPGKDFRGMSASEIKRVYAPTQQLYDLDQKALDRKEARDERRSLQLMTLGEKQRERLEKKQSSMNEIEDRRVNIKENLDKLDKMIEDDGTWEAFGSHNQDLDRMIEQIATDSAKLQDPSSVARPSEVESVKKNLIQSGFKNANSTARDVLKKFRDEVDFRADSAYKVRGLEKPESAAFPKTVRRGSEVATVSNEAELREAMDEGFK